MCGTVKSGDELLVISLVSFLLPSPPTAGTYTIVKPSNTPLRAKLTVSASGSTVFSAPRLSFYMPDRASGANTEESRKNDTPSAAPESSTMTSPGSIASQEEQLRRYSKELYDYTMTLLNDAQADEPQSKKIALLGKPNVLKRTVSDNTVPRTGDGIKD